jgi:hypothetical protein
MENVPEARSYGAVRQMKDANVVPLFLFNAGHNTATSRRRGEVPCSCSTLPQAQTHEDMVV